MEHIIEIFPTSVRKSMEKMDWQNLEEIRIRIGWPVELIYDNRQEWLGTYDCMINRGLLDEMLNYITDYSLYAYEEEIRQGYLPFTGGHRIGVTGRATYETTEINGQKQVKSLVDIGGLNIRIAHEKKNCAMKIVPYLKKGNSIYNTLFFAAPGIGKTTYLRDTIRLLAEEKKVCVIDERHEIAACFEGKPQYDLGKRCDVLEGCPKALGMKMLLRSMSPDIIAVDELGKPEEFLMLEEMAYSGVKVLGTLHARDKEELFRNPLIKKALKNHSLERFVELKCSSKGERHFCIWEGEKLLAEG